MPTDSELKEGKLKITKNNLENEEDIVDPRDAKVVGDPDTQPNPIEQDVGEKLDSDFQTAQDFKDELIPLAFEYYLNVINH
jgi:hypothetical protein